MTKPQGGKCSVRKCPNTLVQYAGGGQKLEEIRARKRKWLYILCTTKGPETLEEDLDYLFALVDAAESLVDELGLFPPVSSGVAAKVAAYNAVKEGKCRE